MPRLWTACWGSWWKRRWRRGTRLPDDREGQAHRLRALPGGVVGVDREHVGARLEPLAARDAALEAQLVYSDMAVEGERGDRHPPLALGLAAVALRLRRAAASVLTPDLERLEVEPHPRRLIEREGNRRAHRALALPAHPRQRLALAPALGRLARAAHHRCGARGLELHEGAGGRAGGIGDHHARLVARARREPGERSRHAGAAKGLLGCAGGRATERSVLDVERGGLR